MQKTMFYAILCTCSIMVFFFCFFLEGLCDFFCKKKKTEEKEASFFEKEITECK